jgi:thiamine biosynthesis lipoprotein
MDYSGLSDEEFDALADKVEATLEEFHKLYDIYNEYEGITNLASINKNAGNGQLKVDEKIIDMLLYSKEMHELTGGKVNVAMGAVLKIWHDYRTVGKEVPSMDILTSAAEHTDIDSLIIDKENLTVELLDPQMSLDVGAIAKGYATEMTAKMLESEGYTSLVLDIGGNLRAIGEKPNKKGWTAGVTNPQSPYSQTYVYTLEMKNSALVTSGGYQRFYTVDGVSYHHIINDETLMPENYYLSVSIKSPSSAMSDALSTAVFNMKYDDAVEFIRGLDGVFAVFVLPSGEVKTAGK